MKILHDAIDLMRLRVNALIDYRYPWWQVVLVLLAVAAAGLGVMPLKLHTSVLNQLLFIAALNGMTLLLVDRTLRFWLGQRWAIARGFSGWTGEGRFFALLVLCSTPSFFVPLVELGKPDVVLMLSLALSVFVVYLNISSVARAVGARYWYVLIGFVLSAPLLVWLGMVSGSLLFSLHWVTQADIDALTKIAYGAGK